MKRCTSTYTHQQIQNAKTYNTRNHGEFNAMKIMKLIFKATKNENGLGEEKNVPKVKEL